MKPSKYHFELWSRGGELLADLAGRAKNRRITQSRNEAEEIQWQLNLDEFEEYCRTIGAAPSTLLVPGSTEVRIRRGQSYLCGGQLVYRQLRITPATRDIELKATGFLNLFKDRYTAPERIFTGAQATTIGSTLITESQAQGGDWDFGVTIGSLATVGVHDRTYKRTNIKDALQNLTNVQVAPFDFEFTHDRVFNTYAALGSRRPEIIFEYPGNIKTLRVPMDGTSIANRIYVLGSGAGEEAAAQAEVDDLNSQLNYKVREKIIQRSSVEETDTLEDHGESETAAWGFPFEIPILEVDGNRAPFVTDYGIGDYVLVNGRQRYDLLQLNGLFRVERREISIDEEDNESVNLFVSR